NSIADHVFSTFAYFGFSVPTFFTGLVLIIIFSVKLHWLPFVYDSNLKINDFGSLVAQLRQSIMPIAVLGFFEAAVLTRYIRAEMLEHLPLDYVRTARAKGLLERFVVIRHVLRNSLIPVVTIIALGVPAIFGGAIVTEQVFHVPGIGELLVRSIFQGDRLAMMGLFLLAFLVLAVIIGPYLYTGTQLIDFARSLEGPSPEHLMGTDDLGRDLLGRVLNGGRISIAVGLTAVFIAITLGTTVGAIAGYFGKLDNPLMRITDL